MVAEFIREIDYSIRLSNMVMVKKPKKNGGSVHTTQI